MGYIIHLTPGPNEIYGCQTWGGDQTNVPDNCIWVPIELHGKLFTEGYYIGGLVIEDDVLVDIVLVKHPIELWQNETLHTLSAACRTAITGGVSVTLSSGETEHFSLEETDQINLSAAASAVAQGVEGYPYHADGQLCRMYPAGDILAIVNAAARHKLYHTTYYNHLMTWIRRTEEPQELSAITYGAELPDDLAEHMKEVLDYAEAI